MTEHPPTGLTVHLTERLDVLVDALRGCLDGVRDDPFAVDLVCVPGPGVQRWVAQRLSEQVGAGPAGDDGVCAGISFQNLRRLCDEVVAQAGSYDAADDPWAGDRLVWAVLRAFDTSRGEPWFAPLAAHLAEGDEDRPGRRYTTARRLGGLFRRWLQWRPAELEAWLTTDDRWQARLWRAVADQVDGPDPFVRRRSALERLVREPGVVSLPPAVHAVVPGRLPPGVREVLAALALHRDCHVWLVVPDAVALAESQPTGPLAGSLSQARTSEAKAWCEVAGTMTVHRAPAAADSVLGRIQTEVRGAASGPPLTGTGDRSVQIHASHGPERQVEVLRDVVVDLLHRDPTLEPRDIVVLTPELDTYGPLVRARCALDLADDTVRLHPAHRVRVAVADRSLREANPVLDVLSRVLDLVTSRGEVGELLDLCATAPVARRFGFAGADERLATLMRGSGMRWGLDAAARHRFGVATTQNTWQAGLNRLLLGVAMSERGLPSLGLALPYDLVESQDIPLLGSLAELVGRLRAAADAFARPASPAEWADRFRTVLLGETDEAGVVVGGLVSVPAADAWQVAQAQAQLGSIAEAAGPDAPPLALGDIRALLRERLQGKSSRSALLTGNLTVTTPDALAHVPHRAIVLLGLDEQHFPRPVLTEGDDPLERVDDEANPALDDRQAFLDAVMAAVETFVVIYRGRDTRTNDVVPQPIPVRDLVAAVTRVAPQADVLVAHRLQPYDLEGFAPGSPPTYDAAAAADARALLDGRSARARAVRDRFSAAGVPAYPLPDVLTVDELVSFMRDPLAAFRTARLGLGRSWSDESSDQIPLELEGLDGWAVKDRLLALRLAGHDKDAAERSERLRGSIPPGALGSVALATHSSAVDQLLANAAPLLAQAERQLDVNVALPSGVTLTGRVRLHGNTVVLPVTGFPRGRHVVEVWVRLLVGAAADPDACRQGALVSTRTVLRLWAPPDPAALLTRLVQAYAAGMSGPLVLPPDTAWAAACDRAAAAGDESQARRQWSYESRTWSGVAPASYDALLTTPGHGGATFTALVDYLYGPIAAARSRAGASS